MWALPKPPVDSASEDLDLVLNIGTKRPHATTNQRDAILDLYALYERRAGRPSEELLGLDLPEDVLDAMHRGYGQVQDGRRLAQLRSALKLGATECPYCGFGEIQDLDHHLQRSIYKALSIFALNLVPVCATCNRHKSRTPAPDTAKQLLNAYLEDPNGAEFFQAVASMDGATGGLVVKFTVVKPDGMSAELHSRLSAHVDEFRLNERLVPQVNNYLAAISTALEDSWGNQSADDVRDYLIRSARANARQFGENSWRTALLLGLADCAEFCDGGFLAALGARP